MVCEKHSAFEWIPHTAKSKAFEVVDVDGGKILDALADEGEGKAIVVGPPASEVPRGEPWPVGLMEGAAVARETDDLPGRMPTKLVTDLDGIGGRQRLAEDGGIAQQDVELDEGRAVIDSRKAAALT